MGSGHNTVRLDDFLVNLALWYAPRDVKRVDVGKVKGEQTHTHFKDDSALNKDGTWKHGESTLCRATQKWLIDNGWNLPK